MKALNWKTRAYIQNAADRVPGGKWLYRQAQHRIGRMRRPSIVNKLGNAARLLNALALNGNYVTGKNLVEIGAGWMPVLPMTMWACGANSVKMFDLERMMDSRSVLVAAEKLVRAFDRSDGLPAGVRDRIDRKRMSALKGWISASNSGDSLLQLQSLDYCAPGDATHSGLPDCSVDMVFSNTVLEHVPRGTIVDMFTEARRILRDGGVMFHLVDPSDHFAHTDASISEINFLKYSDNEFDRFNSSFLFQNRLRAPEYLKMIEEARFKIVHNSARLNQNCIVLAESFPFSKQFQHYSINDLCSFSVCIVAEKVDRGLGD